MSKKNKYKKKYKRLSDDFLSYIEMTNSSIKYHEQVISALVKKVDKLYENNNTNNKPVENENIECKSVVIKGFLG